MPSTTVQKLLLVVSIFLIIGGLVLTISGVFSPAWQVVDIREFRAEHQHGLWWDCIRAEKHVVAVGDFYDEAPLHCMYKFDQSAELVIENTLQRIDEDGAAGESEHHKFWGWHKLTLFLIISSQILAFVSICTGACAPCFRPSTFVFTFALFISMVFSVMADGIAFFSMNRVDTRFVQGMVGTYEQRIGYAFYLHIAGTICWMLAFCACIATTYEFLTSNNRNRPSPYQQRMLSDPLIKQQQPYTQPQQIQPQYIKPQSFVGPKPRKSLLKNGQQREQYSPSIVSAPPRVYRETMA